jgi:hypothetical protein
MLRFAICVLVLSALVLGAAAPALAQCPPYCPYPPFPPQPPMQPPPPGYPPGGPYSQPMGFRCATPAGVCPLAGPGPLGFQCSCPSPFGIAVGRIVN